MPGSILGTSVRRVEDLDLITGASTYVGNLDLDGLLHLAFVRSPAGPRRDHRRSTPPRPRPRPGVVAVFTAADLDLPAHHGLMVVNPELPRPPLATDRVRFVGEAVAVVVAETKAAAVDAVELVEVDYDPLPAVVDPEAALAPDAPLQFAGLRHQPRRRARAPAEPTARWPAPRSWSAPAWSTSGWRSCRWRATRSPCDPVARRTRRTS